jgi:hypothetical protein
MVVVSSFRSLFFQLKLKWECNGVCIAFRLFPCCFCFPVLSFVTFDPGSDFYSAYLILALLSDLLMMPSLYLLAASQRQSLLLNVCPSGSSLADMHQSPLVLLPFARIRSEHTP